MTEDDLGVLKSLIYKYGGMALVNRINTIDPYAATFVSNTARNILICELHDTGISNAELAQRFKLSSTRISQIIQKADRRKRLSDKSQIYSLELSSGVVGQLHSMGFHTIASIVLAIQNGEIFPECAKSYGLVTHHNVICALKHRGYLIDGNQ